MIRYSRENLPPPRLRCQRFIRGRGTLASESVSCANRWKREVRFPGQTMAIRLCSLHAARAVRMERATYCKPDGAAGKCCKACLAGKHCNGETAIDFCECLCGDPWGPCPGCSFVPSNSLEVPDDGA